MNDPFLRFKLELSGAVYKPCRPISIILKSNRNFPHHTFRQFHYRFWMRLPSSFIAIPTPYSRVYICTILTNNYENSFRIKKFMVFFWLPNTSYVSPPLFIQTLVVDKMLRSNSQLHSQCSAMLHTLQTHFLKCKQTKK